mmetsp:Transcript_90891/g.278234  ORF Transcript_90891/g.278234 Transcript_90891/m.278234 type:complete len:214 (+) Transcript_90891:1016-1657(+)
MSKYRRTRRMCGDCFHHLDSIKQCNTVTPTSATTRSPNSYFLKMRCPSGLKEPYDVCVANTLASQTSVACAPYRRNGMTAKHSASATRRTHRSSTAQRVRQPLILSGEGPQDRTCCEDKAEALYSLQTAGGKLCGLSIGWRSLSDEKSELQASAEALHPGHKLVHESMLLIDMALLSALRAGGGDTVGASGCDGIRIVPMRVLAGRLPRAKVA